MSKADKMFEELGYEKTEEQFKITYERYYNSPIIFNTQTKTINVYTNMSMKELQSINKKCRELGWLDE